MIKIIIINGPNLNMLGKRDTKNYGEYTLKDLNLMLKKKFPKIKFKFIQTNYEGKIIDNIQKYHKYDGLLINPAGYTHTSIAIRDALEIVDIPKVGVHLSNILQREDFRKTDYTKDVLDKVFFGNKENSYIEAINYLVSKINKDIV